MRDATKELASGDAVPLAGGKPFPSLFPIAGIELELRGGGKIRVSDDDLVQGNDYGQAWGLDSLLSSVKEITTAVHGVPRDATFGYTTSMGNLGALFLVLDLTVNRGDYVLLDCPTFTATLTALHSLAARPVDVRTDGDGLDPDALEAILSGWDETARGGAKPKVLVTVPTGGNPSGMSTTTARKRRVLEICGQHGVLLLEDDPYYHLSFDPEPPTSYLSLLHREPPSPAPPFLRFDSFAKLISAGARVSWVVGTPALVDLLELYTMGSVQHASLLAEALVATVIKHWGVPGFLKHADEARDFYRAKRDRCLALAEEHLKGICEWEVPQAGMFLWLQLVRGPKADWVAGPDGGGFFDSTKAVIEGLLPAGVILVPGQPFMPEPVDACPFIRISYSMATDEQMEKGFRRMGEVLRARIDGEGGKSA
ncbi:pyridoxal phosphate-dependent transferase [Hyaloraphidium curvatum]|nr:pyridoxal phosphate-dependent transferase [Hyaloraphidium curvatum]